MVLHTIWTAVPLFVCCTGSLLCVVVYFVTCCLSVVCFVAFLFFFLILCFSLLGSETLFFVYLFTSRRSLRQLTPASQRPVRPHGLWRRRPITPPTSATFTSTRRSPATVCRWDNLPTSRFTRPRPPTCLSKPSATW